MVKRKGPRGTFFGCSNYKGKENKFSCKYTEPFSLENK
jgi:ssDNA-binding Zn-finger/Zn-ribbon topoisomerase 1